MNFLKQQKQYVIIILIAAFYFVFASVIPLAQDDWEWYVTGFDQWFNRHFEDLNGRYIGNILEILVVRNLLLRMVVYTVVSMLVLWMILRLIHKENSRAFLVMTFTALLLMPNPIFKQTYAWFAGFNNYVTSALCALVILGMVIQIVTYRGQQPKHYQKIELILFYLACLAGQLLMESVTLYNMAIIGVGLIVYWMMYRKINTKLLIGLGFACIGSVIMFSNPNYLNMLSGNTSYQKVGAATSLSDKVIETMLRTIPYHGYFTSGVFLTVLALVLLYVLYHSPKFLNLAARYKIILTLGIVCFTVYKYIVYDGFKLADMVHVPWIALLNSSVCLIYFCAIAIGVYFVGLPRPALLTVYFCFASIVIVELPLFVVSPVGPRSFYFVYLLWLIVLLTLLKQIHLPMRRTTVIFGSIALVSSLLFLSVFSFMTYTNHQRIEKLKDEAAHAQKGQVITVENLPFEAYTQHTSPWSEETQRVFKQYWHIPNKVQLKFVPYGETYKQEKEEKIKKAKEQKQAEQEKKQE